MTDTPTIPHSREAEEAVLGAVMINPDMYLELCHKLRSSDFYLHRNGFIWDAFRRLHDKEIAIDFLTVQEELEKGSQLEEIGGPPYLTSLISQVPSSLNAEHYADIVFEHSLRRTAINAANEIAGTAYNESNSGDDVVSAVHKASVDIAKRSNGKRLKSAQQVADAEFERMVRVAETGELPGVPTGFLDLDHLLKNMRAGDLDIIAGRPGMGKTALLQGIVQKACSGNKKHKVLIAQVTDLDTDGWTERMVSIQSGVSLEKIRSANLDDEEARAYNDACKDVGSWHFMIDDTPHMSVDKLFGIARQAQIRLRGLDLIVVDYLQKMGVPSRVEKYSNRVQEVGYISGNLKRLAREFKIPVLAAAQLSRKVEDRHDKRPIVSDLRESGEIENDADVIMLIYRDDVYNKSTSKPNIAEINVAKHRNGPTGIMELLWRPHLTKYENVAKY